MPVTKFAKLQKNCINLFSEEILALLRKQDTP